MCSAEVCMGLTLIVVTVLGAANPTIKDLYQSLNTRKSIWLWQRSYALSPLGDQGVCVRDKMDYLNYTDYTFQRLYLWNGQLQRKHFRSKLVEGTGAVPLKVVYVKPGSKRVSFQLRYWSWFEKCSVFTLLLSGHLECEMYVWSSNIFGFFPQCKRVYKKYCRGVSYKIFSVTCPGKRKV